MRGILDAAHKLAVVFASWGASVVTSVETSAISPPTSTDIMKEEEDPERVELEWKPSRDGVSQFNVHTSSSEVEVERVWTGDEDKERDMGRGELSGESSRLSWGVLRAMTAWRSWVAARDQRLSLLFHRH
jgi:hypothetical protein